MILNWFQRLIANFAIKLRRVLLGGSGKFSNRLPGVRSEQ